jgi:hypothetical protein
VRREALEEVGATLGSSTASVRPGPVPASPPNGSPSTSAPIRLADRVATGGGLAEENEEIEVLETLRLPNWPGFRIDGAPQRHEDPGPAFGPAPAPPRPVRLIRDSRAPDPFDSSASLRSRLAPGTVRSFHDRVPVCPRRPCAATLAAAILRRIAGACAQDSTPFTLTTGTPRTPEQLAMRFDKADLSIKVLPDRRRRSTPSPCSTSPPPRRSTGWCWSSTPSSPSPPSQVDGRRSPRRGPVDQSRRPDDHHPARAPDGRPDRLRSASPTPARRMSPRTPRGTAASSGRQTPDTSRGSPPPSRARAATCSGPVSTTRRASPPASTCISPSRRTCRPRPTAASSARPTTATARPPGTGPPPTPTPMRSPSTSAPMSR